MERLVGGIFFSILGALSLLGALRNWRWVLNPQHPIAKYLGMPILRGFALILGVIFLTIGLADLFWALF
jgi:hypothetical protein